MSEAAVSFVDQLAGVDEQDAEDVYRRSKIGPTFQPDEGDTVWRIVPFKSPFGDNKPRYVLGVGKYFRIPKAGGDKNDTITLTDRSMFPGMADPVADARANLAGDKRGAALLAKIPDPETIYCVFGYYPDLPGSPLQIWTMKARFWGDLYPTLRDHDKIGHSWHPTEGHPLVVNMTARRDKSGKKLSFNGFPVLDLKVSLHKDPSPIRPDILAQLEHLDVRLHRGIDVNFGLKEFCAEFGLDAKTYWIGDDYPEDE